MRVEFAAELQASLQEFTATGIVEVHENGGRVAPFSGMSWEVRGAGELLLLHLWSEQFNLTRRVLAITDHTCHCRPLTTGCASGASCRAEKSSVTAIYPASPCSKRLRSSTWLRPRCDFIPLRASS
jgi:hypothetical protein